MQSLMHVRNMAHSANVIAYPDGEADAQHQADASANPAADRVGQGVLRSVKGTASVAGNRRCRKIDGVACSMW